MFHGLKESEEESAAAVRNWGQKMSLNCAWHNLKPDAKETLIILASDSSHHFGL